MRTVIKKNYERFEKELRIKVIKEIVEKLKYFFRQTCVPTKERKKKILKRLKKMNLNLQS